MQKIKYKIFHMEIYKYTPHGFPDMKEEVQKMFLSMIIFYLKIKLDKLPHAILENSQMSHTKVSSPCQVLSLVPRHLKIIVFNE